MQTISANVIIQTIIIMQQLFQEIFNLQTGKRCFPEIAAKIFRVQSCQRIHDNIACTRCKVLMTQHIGNTPKHTLSVSFSLVEPASLPHARHWHGPTSDGHLSACVEPLQRDRAHGQRPNTAHCLCGRITLG